MKFTSLFVISLWLLGMSLPASAAINAWLDQYRVSPGETVQLTLQHGGQTSSQPDLGPLQQDFEIIGRSSSSNVQIVNGKMNSQTQLNLTLVPKRDGKLQIPALQWDGQTSPPLTLTVSSNAAASPTGRTSTTSNPHVFIVASLAQQSSYVQAAVKLTVRLYTDEPLYQASLDLPSDSDVMIKRVGKDLQGNEMRNGRNYQMIERHYLLFPQRSGRIRLDGPVLNAQVQDANKYPFGSNPFFGNIFGRNPFSGMLNSTRPIRIQGNTVELGVLPRPAGSTGHDWLPAQNVTLQESWKPDNGTINTGDPVTLHLHLSATGLLASQLPDLSQLVSLPPGIRSYPDQPTLDSSPRGDSIVGTRDQDIALIANSAGHYVIPALHLLWWNTAQNRQQEIDLPAHTLEVHAGTAAISAGTAAPDRTAIASEHPVNKMSSGPSGINLRPSLPDHRWIWISLVFALLWLGTVIAWWISSRRHSSRNMPEESEKTPAVPPPHLTKARNAFRQACQENNPQTARRNLLDWARAAWPQDPPLGLRALARKLGDPGLEPLLLQLDRACYADEDWQGSPLLDSLKTLTKETKETVAPPQLAGLYS